MFGRLGRIWLARQIVPDDERAAIERHLRALDRLGEDLDVLDREIARAAIEDLTVKRLLTITGVNLIVAAGLAAAIGDVHRFPDPQSLVSYVGLNPRVRQSGLGLAQHGRISKRGRSHARAMLVAPCWSRQLGRHPKHRVRFAPFFCVSEPAAVTRSRPLPWRASWPCCAGIC